MRAACSSASRRSGSREVKNQGGGIGGGLRPLPIWMEIGIKSPVLIAAAAAN